MSGRVEVTSLVLAAGLCCMPLQGARAQHGLRYGGGFNSTAPTEVPTATPTLRPAGTPRLQLVSARDHVEGAFTGHRAVYADRGHIYLASSLTAARTLFVLARDRTADFPPSPAPCVGDCDQDGWVTIDELITAVNIALGADMSQCLAADRDGNGSVTVDELLTAVRIALEGCRRSLTFHFNFAQGPQGWESLFTNYDVGDEQRLALVADYRPLPEPLDPEQEALFISGKNVPDDLNMFFKRRVEGLDPQLNYSVAFEVEIASNAPSGCPGVGGAPGEAVTVHALASGREPDRVVDEHVPPPYYRLNLAVDYGDMWYADTQLGHIGNSSHDCDSSNWRYELKRLGSLPGYWQVRPDAQGRVWLLVGTRSGFESTTSLYYTEVSATLDPL